MSVPSRPFLQKKGRYLGCVRTMRGVGANVRRFTPSGYEGRPEKAAGQYPAASRAQNCVLSKWPRPPRLSETCIGRAKVANQNRCSNKGTKKMLRRGHTTRATLR